MYKNCLELQRGQVILKNKKERAFKLKNGKWIVNKQTIYWGMMSVEYIDGSKRVASR